MKTINLFLLLTLSSCLFAGKSALNFNDRNQSISLEVEKVDFKFLDEKILTPKCMNCHDDLDSEAAWNEFVVPGDPEKSPLFELVKSGEMPRRAPPLSTAELEIIEIYIKGLASPR